MDSVVVDSFTVTNTGPSTIRILSVTPTIDVVSATISSNKIKSGESAVVACRFTPKKNGTVKGNIIITTDNSQAPSIDVRFFALVGERKPYGASADQN